MSIRNILAGLILVGTIAVACSVWLVVGFVPGAITFLVGAFGSGMIHT